MRLLLALTGAALMQAPGAIRTPPAADAPRINGPRVYGQRPGRPFFYHLPVSGRRPMTLAASGLPDGLVLDGATGNLTGTVARAGEYPVTFTATNAFGSASAVVRLVLGPKLCLTPPMGWNSWNCFHRTISDEQIRAAAEALVATRLIDHGWSYVNLDDCWQGTRDAAGAIRGSAKFPDMRALAEFIHAKGLKAGLYSSPGPQTCENAVGSYGHEEQDAATYAAWGYDYLKYDLCTYNELIMLLRGERYGALLAADKQRETAQLGVELAVLNSLIYRHDPTTFPPSAAVADAIARFKGLDKDALTARRTQAMHRFRELTDEARRANPAGAAAVDEDYWRESFLKMRLALDTVDRDIVLSCSGGGLAGRKAGGQLWRTTTDITATWASVEGIGFAQHGLERWAGPGGWNDPDMLEIGNGPLTPDECYTHMTLWCLLSAPLLIGCDLTKLTPLSLSILSNDEVLAVDQDELGRQGWRATQTGATEVWLKPLADGGTALGLFNRGETTAEVAVRWSDLKLSGPRQVRDLWRQRDLGAEAGGYAARVAPHGAELLKLSAAPAA